MTLATAALAATEHEKRASRRAAFLYLVMSHVATGCLIAGFLMLAATSGSTAFTALLSGDVVRGPTRDGLFLIEDGKISRPVTNFRFNQSLSEMLANVQMLGSPTRVCASESSTRNASIRRTWPASSIALKTG